MTLPVARSEAAAVVFDDVRAIAERQHDATLWLNGPATVVADGLDLPGAEYTYAR